MNSKVTTWSDPDGTQHLHLSITEPDAAAMDWRAYALLLDAGRRIHEAFQAEAEARTAHETAHDAPERSS